MNEKISKRNANADFFNARLDEVRMSGHERLKAKARLAQAEAMAEVLAVIVHGAARLARAVVVRPFERLTATFN